MDQSEIDALMKGGKPAAAKPRKHPTEAKSSQADTPKVEGQVISEIDAVTAVTERETNKVMDQLDLIGQLVGRQQQLITDIMKHPGAQNATVLEAIHQVMSAGKEIQDKVFEAMDLMQFQDITRQKLERIVYHLRQIHDYIVDLLGTGLKSEGQRATLNPNIVRTGTTPDEQKAGADEVIAEFKRNMGKG